MVCRGFIPGITLIESTRALAPEVRLTQTPRPALASQSVEVSDMPEATKRVNVEHEPDAEEETKDGVVNDSLGTVDPADSSGLDDNKPTNEKSGLKSTDE
jgi:hypothetical protein